jgi:hypothetical protein
LLQEFQPHNEIDDDFRIHILKVVIGDNEEVEQSGDAQPVIKIEIDHDSRECLLHFEAVSSTYIMVSDIKAEFTADVLDYEVCATQEKILDDTCIRLDTPLIGFGENSEITCFFAVCQA